MGRRMSCEHQIFHATFYQPAEYCGEDAEDGSLYCRMHNPENAEPDWDDVRKDMLVGAYDCD